MKYKFKTGDGITKNTMKPSEVKHIHQLLEDYGYRVYKLTKDRNDDDYETFSFSFNSLGEFLTIHRSSIYREFSYKDWVSLITTGKKSSEVKTYILQKDTPLNKAGAKFINGNVGDNYCCREGEYESFECKFVEDNEEWFKFSEEEILLVGNYITIEWSNGDVDIIYIDNISNEGVLTYGKYIRNNSLKQTTEPYSWGINEIKTDVRINIRLSTEKEIEKFNRLSKFQLPTINGFDGKVKKDYIEYGCAQLPISWFKNGYNRNIKSLKLSSGVNIGEEEIKQIRSVLYEIKKEHII